MSTPDPKAEALLAQNATLVAERSAWDSLWQDCADIVHPRRNQITQKTPIGPPDRTTLHRNNDGTAMRANNTLATGQSVRITPMGARWFILRPPPSLQGNQIAENYFARATEILVASLGTSNFYNRGHECYLDRGCFGIAALEVTGGPNNRGLHFRTYPVGSFSIAQNSFDEVDVIHRNYEQTPAQLLEAFGRKALHEDILKKFDNPATRYQRTEQLIHAIHPRTDRDPRRQDAAHKPYASTYLHKGTNTIILDSGFDELPTAVSRWSTWGESPYGWAPAYAALPEASQLDFLEQMLDTLVETAAFPRVLAPAGMKNEIDFTACGLTMFDPAITQVPQEWLTGGRYDVGKDRAFEKRRAIETAFHVELFNAISQLDPKATATQISAIITESRELFHPIYSNMVREFLTPVLRRSFALLLRQGVIPPPPLSILQTDSLSAFLEEPAVEYVSAMALALEASHLHKFQEIIGVLSPLANLDPTILDYINPATIGAHFHRTSGLPTVLLRTPQELQELQEARAQQAQAQQALQATEAIRNLGGPQETLRAAQQAAPLDA
jgi:hypothetical protein